MELKLTWASDTRFSRNVEINSLDDLLDLIQKEKDRENFNGIVILCKGDGTIRKLIVYDDYIE